jgi:hypothetical protein
MSAYFTPYNRHLVVDLIEEKTEEQESIVVLPSDYKKPASPFVKALVIDVADDSKFRDTLKLNDVILAERRMLHKVEISEYSFYLILENYIYGRINNEID